MDVAFCRVSLEIEWRGFMPVFDEGPFAFNQTSPMRRLLGVEAVLSKQPLHSAPASGVRCFSGPLGNLAVVGEVFSAALRSYSHSNGISTWGLRASRAGGIHVHEGHHQARSL